MTTPISLTQPTLGLHQLVVTDGILGGANGNPLRDPGGIYIGSIRTFAGSFEANGSLFADGQTLSIADQQFLFAALTTTYGGDGTQNFDLPDLRGRLLVGASSSTVLGQTFGSESVTLTRDNMPSAVGGQGIAVNNDQPSLLVRYLINVGGQVGNGAGTDMAGEIVPYLGTNVPNGYLVAD